MSEASLSQPAWYCVRAQTKREHIAASHLRELEGVEVFCPRLRYRKATRRGTVWWMEPLFPGYLLARFEIGRDERAVTFCQGVRGLVRFGSVIPEVPAGFVEALRRELSQKGDGELVTLEPVVEPGDEVEIAVGPLQGMRGTVVSIASATERVKILLEFLGQPQAVEMDLFAILMPRKPKP